MNWNVAQAKQRLSEVIRQAAREPQVIYSRNLPVAAVIAAEELPEYQAWKQSRSTQSTLAEEFDRLRDLAAGDPDPLPEPDRLAAMRAGWLFSFSPPVGWINRSVHMLCSLDHVQLAKPGRRGFV